MLLKDLLSKDVISSLNDISNSKRNRGNRSDKNNKRKLAETATKEKKIVAKNKTKKTSNAKNVKVLKDEFNDVYRLKKHYISECPYCSSTELEVTGNGYYYCGDCGIKVDKIFEY